MFFWLWAPDSSKRCSLRVFLTVGFRNDEVDKVPDDDDVPTRARAVLGRGRDALDDAVVSSPCCTTSSKSSASSSGRSRSLTLGAAVDSQVLGAADGTSSMAPKLALDRRRFEAFTVDARL